MKELKCPNCNCKEMEWKNGLFHCPSCGSNFIPDADEIPKQSEKQKVIDKLIDNFNKLDTQGFLMSSKEYDRWMHRRKKVEKLCSQLEEIDPCHPYVDGVKMLLYFCDGLKDSFAASMVIFHTEELIKHADRTEHEDILALVKTYFLKYEEKILELQPQDREQVENIKAYFAELEDEA